MDSKKLAAEHYAYTVAIRRDLHRHPEPSFAEFRTTDAVAGALRAIGIPFRRFEPTGLLGTIEGGGSGPTVGLRADLDALSIVEKSGVDFASENPGYMHACGHDAHTAMLLGAAKALYENRAELPGTVKLLFQPAEETAQGAKRVIAQGALEGMDRIFALHIFAQTPAGTLAIAEGPVAAASDRFTIRVKGRAAHGAMPEAGIDALAAASAVVLNLQSLVSREISPMEPAVVTVGKFQAGSRFNIIAAEAELEGTVRSFNQTLSGQLPDMVKRVAQRTAEAYRCTAEVEWVPQTRVLVNDAGATACARSAALKAAPSPHMVVPLLKMMGAEDFGEYTARIKGSFAALGGGGDYPQHSDYFFIEEEAMKTGVAWYIQVAYESLRER